MFRKSAFRYFIAGLLILILIGAGSMMAYRVGLSQGAGFDSMPFIEGEYGSMHDGYGHGSMQRGYGFMPYGQSGHHGGFGFFGGGGFFGMLFHLFLAVLAFKFIFRLLFFPMGMHRYKKMRRHMHGSSGMWGWHDDEWDEDESKPTDPETKNEEE